MGIGAGNRHLWSVRDFCEFNGLIAQLQHKRDPFVIPQHDAGHKTNLASVVLDNHPLFIKSRSIVSSTSIFFAPRSATPSDIHVCIPKFMYPCIHDMFMHPCAHACCCIQPRTRACCCMQPCTGACCCMQPYIHACGFMPTRLLELCVEPWPVGSPPDCQ